MTHEYPLRPVRRIVTGHNEDGKSVFVSDGDTPCVFRMKVSPTIAQVIWGADKIPVEFAANEEPAPDGKMFPIAPEGSGVVLRYVDFAPDSQYQMDRLEDAMNEVGGQDVADRNARHFSFHKTASLDFGIVLEGEVWALMDEGEKKMGPGDVLIQRGTNHSWSNRTDKVCRVAFVLIGAQDNEVHP